MRPTTTTRCPRERIEREEHRPAGHPTDRALAAGRYSLEQLHKVIRVNVVHGVHTQVRPAGVL
jgi:hypothetical protein